MESLILGYYIGLLVFAVNGIIYMGLRQERYSMRARDERLRRILISRRR